MIAGQALFYDFGMSKQSLAHSKGTLETLNVDKWLLIDCVWKGPISALTDARSHSLVTPHSTDYHEEPRRDFRRKCRAWKNGT
jgi:hypothetical protein